MSKNKDQKRKVQLATRAKYESFRFQVEFTRKQKCIDIMGMEQNLTTELDAICQNNLTGGTPVYRHLFLICQPFFEKL